MVATIDTERQPIALRRIVLDVVSYDDGSNALSIDGGTMTVAEQLQCLGLGVEFIGQNMPAPSAES